MRKISILLYRLIDPLINPVKLIKGLPRYTAFFRDLFLYSRMKNAEKMSFINLHPCIHNKTETTQLDPHYFYSHIWAFKKIREDGAGYHVDCGSQVNFVGILSAITKVNFIDIRPLEAKLENFSSKKGSILEMPFEDNSVKSLSCLHVAEHIGLGRYGDPLDPLGTKKACRELARVLAPNGNLYFSLPVGRPRLCFNAHRIHSPRQIIEYFDGLELVELSGVDDKKSFIRNIDITILERSDYACAMFHFRKI